MPAAGNGIFGCRDKAPKITAKMRERLQRPKSGSEWPENPAETPYLASYRKRAVCKDWMVVCAVRYEPVSLLLAKNRAIFEKNSERIAENTK